MLRRDRKFVTYKFGSVHDSARLPTVNDVEIATVDNHISICTMMSSSPHIKLGLPASICFFVLMGQKVALLRQRHHHQATNEKCCKTLQNALMNQPSPDESHQFSPNKNAGKPSSFTIHIKGFSSCSLCQFWL